MLRVARQFRHPMSHIKVQLADGHDAGLVVVTLAVQPFEKRLGEYAMLQGVILLAQFRACGTCKHNSVGATRDRVDELVIVDPAAPRRLTGVTGVEKEHRVANKLLQSIADFRVGH